MSAPPEQRPARDVVSRASSRLRRSSAARGAATGDELVLLHLERGVYYTLNETGAWIWEQLEREPTLHELRDGLVTHFTIDAECAERDLVALITELEAESLIVRVAADSSPLAAPSSGT